MKNLISKFYFSHLLLFNRPLFIFAFLILGLPKDSFSQNTLQFQRYGVEQGLTVTTAFSIVQDDRGFLWISTIDGLHRYDGYDFSTYKNDFNDTLSLSDNTLSTIYKDSKGNFWTGTYNEGVNCFDPRTAHSKHFRFSNNRVWCAVEDNAGNIWIGTDNGLNKLDPVSGKTILYQHNESDGYSISSNRILCLTKDHTGQIWAGTDNGLNLISADDPKKLFFKHFFHDKDDPGSISSNIILSVYEGKDNMWIGTVDGLNRLDQTKFRIFRFSADSASAKKQSDISIYSYLNSYGENSIRGIWQRNANELWLATDQGVKILDPKTARVTSYHSDALDASTLSAELCLCFCPDRSGNLWIGTMTGGINKLDLKPKKFPLIQTNFGNPYNISSNNVRSIFIDNTGTLWIGTLGGGLNKMNLTTGKFERVREKYKGQKEIFDPENVWAIDQDPGGKIWIGTSKGLWCHDPIANSFKVYRNDPADPNSISDNIIRCILFDNLNELWVGTENGLNMFVNVQNKFQRFMHNPKNQTSISNNTVWTIKEVNGSKWVGTDDGLNRINYNKDHSIAFQHYDLDENNKRSLSNKSVRAISIDKDANMWVGTNNGLNKYVEATDDFDRFNEESGLPNSFIYSVLTDKNGDLWISTNFGLARYIAKTNKFRNYDKLDGLQNNEFNTGAYLQAKNGILFFGGPDGLNFFDPMKVQDNRNPPPVVITSIKLFGAEMERNTEASEVKDITLRYDQNVIAFEFAALDLTQPEKNKYAYQLIGFDQQLIQSGSHRFVNYTNLDPGEYTFNVFASNNDGIWNNEALSIHITIVPPFWKTWWFSTACAAFVILSVYFFISTRIRRLRKTQDKLELQVQIKTKELREEKELVESQKKVIERTNHNMTSSIRYAKRIQESILPMKEKLNELMPESFIFFRPKDIVSGDFYWLAKTGDEKNEKIVVAAVDCTGHGVPGAFMSLIGNNLLNNIVINKKTTDPKKILEKLHDGVVLALKKDEQESGTVDGMDITLCVIDVKNTSLEFASTGQALLVVNGSGLAKHKIGKHPVGFISNKETVFEKEKLQLSKGDTFYIFTDGYCDQFGGKDDDKFLESNFEKLLLEIKDKPMDAQAVTLETTIDKWKGKTPQLDDILVIGLRF